jgi:hypothetical protein
LKTQIQEKKEDIFAQKKKKKRKKNMERREVLTVEGKVVNDTRTQKGASKRRDKPCYARMN